MDLIPSLGEGSETPTLLGPFERENLNHWTSSGRWTKYRNPAILLYAIVRTL
jgi:hypothetical protein